jgi:hypothetical protein
MLLLHAAATWFMVGLIWMVQLVHYPLFGQVGEDKFAAYARQHTRAISWLVGPPMLIELACALLLVLWPPLGGAWAAWGGLGLLALIWLSTALFQVPAHTRLQQGFDPLLHRGLVQSNWLRTVGWSLRGLLAMWMLAGGA